MPAADGVEPANEGGQAVRPAPFPPLQLELLGVGVLLVQLAGRLVLGQLVAGIDTPHATGPSSPPAGEVRTALAEAHLQLGHHLGPGERFCQARGLVCGLSTRKIRTPRRSTRGPALLDPGSLVGLRPPGHDPVSVCQAPAADGPALHPELGAWRQLSTWRQGLEAEAPSRFAHPLVVCDDAAEVITRGQRCCQVDRIECAEAVRPQSPRREQEVSVHHQLVERVEMTECHPDIAIDATDGSEHFRDRKLAGHQHIVAAQVLSPLSNRGALALNDRELHDRGGVEIPDAHRSAARSSARASEAGRRVGTGAGSGAVTLAGFKRRASRSRSRAPP